jgi:hypothetical protein
MIRIHSNDLRLYSSILTNMGMDKAIVSAFAVLIAYMALAGRVGAFHIFVLSFFGVFFYGFN